MRAETRRLSNRLLVPLAIATWVAAAPAARGADAADTSAAKYFSDDLPVVLAIDATKLDIDRIDACATEIIRKSGAGPKAAEAYAAEAKEPLERARRWLDLFAKAGGQRAYVCASVRPDQGASPLRLVAPVGAEAAARSIEAALAPAAADVELDVRRFEDAVLVGDKGALRKITAPAMNPSAAAIVDALSAAGDAPIRLVIGRDILSNSGPPAAGGVDTPGAAHGVLWVAVAVSLPPSPEIRVMLGAKDAAAAQSVASQIRDALGRMKDDPRAKQALAGENGSLADALMPKITDQRVTVTLDAATVDRLLPLVVKAAAAAGESSDRQQRSATPSPSSAPAGERR